MKKALLLMLIAVPTLAVPNQLLEQEKEHTVLISNEGFGGVGRGTGVLLDATHVLTCAHMMQSARDNFWIYTYPLGQVLMAHPVVSSSSDDLLLLELTSSATVHDDLVVREAVSEGESITVIGNALGGMKWFISKGVISGEDHGNLLTDAVVNPGNSGGPWFNNRGEMVGITDWRIGPEEEHHVPGFAGGISAERIKLFLKAYEDMQKMEKMLEKLMGGNANARVFVLPK